VQHNFAIKLDWERITPFFPILYEVDNSFVLSYHARCDQVGKKHKVRMRLEEFGIRRKQLGIAQFFRAGKINLSTAGFPIRRPAVIRVLSTPNLGAALRAGTRPLWWVA
jgi:hypothetical protein